MWPMRYLGIHCRVEDALQRDDRAIYPRASSRLGPRHQANVVAWHGHAVELVKPSEIKKRYTKPATKKENKSSKETLAALEADRAERTKRPPWVQDEPPGYIKRGLDFENADKRNTARLIFGMPTIDELPDRGGDGENYGDPAPEDVVAAYMTKARALASSIGVQPHSTNYLDRALQLLTDNKYNAEAALKQLQVTTKRRDLKEPELTKEELKRFEEAVGRYGSEHRLIQKYVKTVKHADIVRFYYMWKKTDRGREIWGSFEGRRGTKKKIEASNSAKAAEDFADQHDDSAFDEERAAQRKRGFCCKFCLNRHSRRWHKAPNTAPGQTIQPEGKANREKNGFLLAALCERCASLWRKYGIKWEDINEIARKVQQAGGRASKRKVDEDLLNELIVANEQAGITSSQEVAEAGSVIGATVTVEQPVVEQHPKKKLKADKDTAGSANPPEALSAIKKKKKEITPAVASPPPLPFKEPTPPPDQTLQNYEICRALCAGLNTQIPINT